MKPMPLLHTQCQKTARGFAVISALFILVVLAALGAFIMSISSNQQIGSALDVQGVRAYAAARSGVEWGLFQVNSTPAYNFGYTSTDPNTRACPVSPTSFIAAATTLTSFTITVTCVATSGTNNGPTIYQVLSVACNQPSGGICPNTTSPGSNYVERRLDVTF
jgi:MSHA biogenesis protein MshP